MRIINEARTKLNIAPLKYTEKAQNMANDVAEEYVKDGFSFGVYPRANMTLDELQESILTKKSRTFDNK